MSGYVTRGRSFPSSRLFLSSLGMQKHTNTTTAIISAPVTEAMIIAIIDTPPPPSSLGGGGGGAPGCSGGGGEAEGGGDGGESGGLLGGADTTVEVTESTGTFRADDADEGLERIVFTFVFNATAASGAPLTVAIFMSTTVDPAERVI